MNIETNSYTFPVPSAPPELPPTPIADAAAIASLPVPLTPSPARAGSWIGWGLSIGTAGGALLGLIVGLVLVGRSGDASSAVFIVYGLLLGGVVGFVYGLIVGCLQAIAKRWTSGRSLDAARAVHGFIGLAPLIVAMRGGTPGVALLFGVLPAVVGAVGSELLVERFRGATGAGD
jgi:hypothetical protein